MAHFTPAALAHFASHHGVASGTDLSRCGLTDHAVRALLAANNLEAPLRGAYHLPAVPLDELVRCAIVCTAHPEVAISGPTAGRLWGFRRLPPDRRIHVLAPPASQPVTVNWVVPYRTRAVHAADIVERGDGIVVTSRPRTALDLARTLGSTDLLSVIEQAMHDGCHTADEMREVAVDWISPQRPWLRRYLELLSRRLRGGAAESHGEVEIGDALAAAGVGGLVRQLQIDLPGYGPARFDLAVPAARWAVEVDLHPRHRETAGRDSDSWRDRAAGEVGWAVERVGPDEYLRFDHTISRLVRSHRTRQRALR